MQFWSFGPFDIELPERDNRWKQRFWSHVEAYDEDDEAYQWLRSAIGCYVFIMTRGGKHRPWYVGKTNAKTGFHGEIFTRHKLDHYRDVIKNTPQGWRPQMLLFPLATNSGRLSKGYKTDKALIEWMERTLIGMALAKNPSLYNWKDTSRLRYCIVDGVVGEFTRNQRYPGAIAARKALTDHQDWND